MSASVDRRRFVIGCLLGALPAVLIFGWLVTAGTGNVLAKEPFGSGAFDAQATALLHGHWDVPRSVIGSDSFQIGSKYYMYFGIWPSVLRMPVLELIPSSSGHLTVPSMLLAFVVLLGGAGALYWRIRSLVRTQATCTRGDAALAAIVVFAVGCGTTALFLGSRAIIYHEAILWAAAWALVAYERIIAFVLRPSWARLGGACLCTTLSILSRVTIGAGPVLALGLLGAIELVRMLARGRAARAPDAGRRSLIASIERAGVHEESGRQWLGGIAALLVIPVVAYAWMNYSRFGSLFGIPYRKEIIASLSRSYRDVLDANHGSLFGLKLIPTTLVQIVRPDALSWSPVFPWVTFQRFPTPVFAGASFNQLDFTTSVTASMPAFALLGALGVIAVLWTRVARSSDVAALRTPLIGAAASAAVALAFTFVAVRYYGDWIPLLTIAGLVGLEVLLRRRAESPRRGRWNAAIALVAVLAIFGVWANFSLGILYQRLYAPAEDSLRAGMLSFQYRLSDTIGTGTPDLVHSAQLPEGHGSAGTAWITRQCAALYWSDGRTWNPIEGKPSRGWVRARVDFRGVGANWVPLVAFGSPGRQDVVGVRREPGGMRFALGTPAAGGALVWRPNLVLVPEPPGPRTLTVLADRVNQALTVKVNRAYVLEFSSAPTSGGQVRIAPGPVDLGTASTGGLVPFPGSIRPLAARVSTCQRLLRLRAG